MEFEEILIWASRVSLVVWTGVLIWCGTSIVLKTKKERDWLNQYVPTLEGDLTESEIHSWATMTQFEDLRDDKEQARDKRRGQRKTPPSGG
jgi:hypothetical protein